jgi:hypothetical protein
LEDSTTTLPLEQIRFYIHHNFDQVYCLPAGDRLLKVFPRRPDSRLVDEPCVRLNLLYRQGELVCETYSVSRDLVAQRIISNLEEDLSKVLANPEAWDN